MYTCNTVIEAWLQKSRTSLGRIFLGWLKCMVDLHEANHKGMMYLDAVIRYLQMSNCNRSERVVSLIVSTITPLIILVWRFFLREITRARFHFQNCIQDVFNICTHIFIFMKAFARKRIIFWLFAYFLRKVSKAEFFFSLHLQSLFV